MNPDQNYSLTEEHLALQHFSNRHQFTRQFVEYLNDEPPQTRILFFHGDGGNGKSLLLKFLRKNYCKQFASVTWQQLKAKSDQEFTTAVGNEIDYIELPATWLDFGQQGSDDQARDPFYGLLRLRHNLGMAAKKYKFTFPHYDFACVWYLRQIGKSRDEIKKLYPPEEMELIGVVVDALLESVWANLIRSFLGTLAKYLGIHQEFFWQWGLNQEWVKEVKAMNPDQLISKLPTWFAQDLNAIMQEDSAPTRMVFFLDTHEAFWRERRDLPHQFFHRDEWLRCLLNSLDLSTGIVVVMAGRESPRWAEAPECQIPKAKLDNQYIGHFSTKDARDYCEKAGISDADLQQRLIIYTSVTPDQVHPFYLGLCVDCVRAAQNKNNPLRPEDFSGELATKKLISRLLRYVDEEIQDAIHALSACRIFDRELYHILGKALHFNATPATFRVLTSFSFVWQDDRGYRIHDLLRRLYLEENNDTIRQAHLVLETHYREQRKVAEAIYHLFYQNPEGGIAEWNNVFATANDNRNEDLCRTLLEIRNELSF